MLYKPPNAHQRALRFRSPVCHITGLPYRKNFRETSDITGWHFDGTVKYWNQEDNSTCKSWGYILRYYYKASKYLGSADEHSSNAFTPEMYVPAESSGGISARYIVKFNLGETGADTRTDITVNTGLTTGTSVVKTVQNTYTEYSAFLTADPTYVSNEANIGITNKSRLSISVDKPSYKFWAGFGTQHYALLSSVDIEYR